MVSPHSTHMQAVNGMAPSLLTDRALKIVHLFEWQGSIDFNFLQASLFHCVGGVDVGFSEG